MAIVLMWFLIAVTGRCETESLTLSVGQQKTLPWAKGAVTVTNPRALKVSTNGTTLILTGKQPGLSFIMAGRDGKSMRITVYSQKLIPAKAKVDNWVNDTFGIEFETEPHRLVFTGTAVRLADWLQIHRFRKQFQPLVHSEVRPDPSLLPELKGEVEKAIRQQSLTMATAHLRGDALIITSSQGSKATKAVSALADEWGIEHVIGGNIVELRPMIEIEIVIAEVRKNILQSLGLELPGTYSASLLPSGDLKSLSTTFEPFKTALHLQASRGGARILANPKLLCRSGEAAHFVAGGEIPIKMVNWRTSDIVWKKYGVILDIYPQVDHQEGISTKLVTEISLLDESHKVDGIPGLLTNRIETHFDVRGSKTIALSGLIKSETGRKLNSTPGLADIPILGELFKSREYQDRRTDLAVFVTPRVISPENPPVPNITPLPSLNWSDLDDDL